LFDANTSFNQDIGNWDVSNVYLVGYMFRNATSFNQDLSGWNLDNVISPSLNGSSPPCLSFCYGASSWVLPKPIFNNCSENLGCD